jgi:hypothetical protein
VLVVSHIIPCGVDKEIYRRMHDDHRALFAKNVNERTSYQYPMKTGLEQFHYCLRIQFEPPL